MARQDQRAKAQGVMQMNDKELTDEVKRRMKTDDPRFEGLAFPWPVLILSTLGLCLGIYFGVKL